MAPDAFVEPGVARSESGRLSAVVHLAELMHPSERCYVDKEFPNELTQI